MENNRQSNLQDILKNVQRLNTASVVTTASTAISTVLIPIIITLINKIEETNNTTLIIALSTICIISIISMVFGIITMNSNKGADNELRQSVSDLENFINEYFEVKDGLVNAKDGVDPKAMSQKLLKKYVKHS